MKESPIFVKGYETPRSILERTRKFPRQQRFVMARHIEDAALDFPFLPGAVVTSHAGQEGSLQGS